ncbi:MAG: Cysteine desulfurase [candidate division TM6 bacterium GW2011_GWF2_32_72]|nr:MAG: Cysteine desulfurase [candidate division TM6 bacterium GW2011_GWF2_32_72]
MKNIKDHFPIFKNKKNFIYLDSAATSQKPQVVIDSIVDFFSKFNANIHRGIHELGEDATRMYEASREKVANFIGSPNSKNIVFTKGATEGINLVASAWGEQNIQKGDEILLTYLEHHSNLIPWLELAKKKGAFVKYVPINADGTLDMSTLGSLVSSKTKLVAVTHISNAIGTEVAIQKFVEEAHSVGAKILIDACQSVPHQKLDVETLDCDFLVFSGHKMLASTGIGVLYLSNSVLNEMSPYQYGGGMVCSIEKDKFIWQAAPHKFEAGTPPIAEVISLGAAIDFLSQFLKNDVLRVNEAGLVKSLIEGLQSIGGIKVYGPIDELKKTGHLVSFCVEGIHAHDVAAYLSSKGISVRAGNHCAQPLFKKLELEASVRASFYLYNTQKDVDSLLNALNSLKKEF